MHNGGQRLVREQIENKGPTSSTYPSSLTKTDERNDIWQPRAIVAFVEYANLKKNYGRDDGLGDVHYSTTVSSLSASATRSER